VLAHYTQLLEILFPEITWFSDYEQAKKGDWVAVGHDKTNKWYYQRGSFDCCDYCDHLMNIRNVKSAKKLLKEIENIKHIADNRLDAIQYLKKEAETAESGIKKVIEKIIKKVGIN
jgi:hypothetical protein